MHGRKELLEFARGLGGIPFFDEPRYRIAYNYDATGRTGRCEGVAFPRSADDISTITREASRLGVPLFLRGAGTGFSGGSVPGGGGVVISTEKMRRVLDFDARSRTVEVEAGLVNGDLQEYLGGRGMFYPPDPASFRVSTIGGNIAENAGGPRAYKYGVTRRWVRRLAWVDSAGEQHRSAFEGAAALLAGSEGTLGTICSARLAVLPAPERFVTTLLPAGGDSEALSTAAELLAEGFTPSVLEFIDSSTMSCVSGYTGWSPEGEGVSYLFLEVDGRPEEVGMQQSLLLDFCRRRSLEPVTAHRDEEREALWELRRSVSPSLARMGITKINEDVSLPLGELPAAVGRIHGMAADLGLDCYIFGHCGDGNLHVNIMTDRRRAEEMARAGLFVEELFRYVASRRGTLSGEHGIGVTKSSFLDMVFTPEEMSLQEDLCRSMDPDGTLNPGKYFRSRAGGR